MRFFLLFSVLSSLMVYQVLGAIRMLKFMAWERSFESRVLKIREKELRYQRLTYTIEVLFNAIWCVSRLGWSPAKSEIFYRNSSPILVTLVSFWHFTVIRKQDLTPTIAFTSIIVFNELKFALNALPETFINMLQVMYNLVLNSHITHPPAVFRLNASN